MSTDANRTHQLHHPIPKEALPMSTARKWLPRALPVLVAALALGATSLAVGTASSHREAPLIADDPVADATDTYAFVSPDKPDTVTLVGNWVPLEEPAGGPNFAHFGNDVRYDFDVDNNGDNVPDLVYQFTFKTKVTNGILGSFVINKNGDTNLAPVSIYNVKGQKAAFFEVITPPASLVG